MTVGIGRLRERIDILQKSVVRKDGGGRTETWSVEDTVWANIKNKSSKSLLDHSNKLNTISHIITIRNYAGLTVKKKLRFGTRFFDINGFYIVDERNKYVKIEASENTNADVTVS